MYLFRCMLTLIQYRHFQPRWWCYFHCRQLHRHHLRHRQKYYRLLFRRRRYFLDLLCQNHQWWLHQHYLRHPNHHLRHYLLNQQCDIPLIRRQLLWQLYQKNY